MSETESSIYIVTGASYGIGHAVAKALAARGLPVLAVARSLDRLELLSKNTGPHLNLVAADLATSTGIAQVMDKVPNAVDVAGVVHAAGSVVPLEPLSQVDAEQLVEHFRIHVGAPLALYQSLAQNHWVRRMVYIDSYSATAARNGWGAYSIVKSAAQMAAKCADQELRRTDAIRIFPGAVNTRIVDAVLASDTETAKTFQAMKERGELAKPDDVAAFIVSVLVDAHDNLIRSRPSWDFNTAEDHDLIRGLRAVQ